MFNTLYNVNTNNNLLVLSLNNTDYYVQLTTGLYTTDILYQNIQNSINNQITGESVTVTYDPLLASYTISGFSSPAKFQSSLSTANRLLGFNGDQTGTTLISNSIANINLLDYFYVTSTALSQLTQVIVPNADFNNIILKIIVDNSTGVLVEYTNFSSDRFYTDSVISLSNIDIGIVDKYLKPIPNQERWSMELSLDLVVSQTTLPINNYHIQYNPISNTQISSNQVTTSPSYSTTGTSGFIITNADYQNQFFPNLEYR